MAYGEYEPVLDADGNAVILGKGSFGKVYLVRKAKLGRRYALKLLGHQALGKTSSAHGRFLREVSTFADLRHTHIVTIADYGECEEGAYYVMDFCEGGSLETLVRNLRPFSVSLTLRLLDKAAAALEYAHAKGLIHRDIKPENLMLLSPAERDDDLPDLIRLIDFGLAKDLSAEPGGDNVSLTLESQVIGTPLYMSPEQLAGSSVDHRADIFSLGITGWYLLAGPQAFSHLHNGTLIRQDRFSPIPYSSKLPDHLTGKARAVIARMIEKDESRRFQDYRSLREALRAALQEELQAALAPPDAGPPGPAALPAAAAPEPRYTALTPLGRDPATGGSLWSALCAGQSVQLVTAPAALAPALSQLLGRLDVPERPASLVPYDRAGFSPQHPDFPGCCVCTTRTPGGPDLLSILRNRPRTTLEEAKGPFQQIAEAMDFARPREIALRFAPGEILLPGLSLSPAGHEFAEATVRLFPTLHGASGPEAASVPESLGATVVQHSSIPGTGIPTHRDFAALIYRVLAGREIDPGAFHSTRNYKGIGSLQTKTDGIIRDLICGLYPAQSCRALLLALCSSESIRLPERPQPEAAPAPAPPPAVEVAASPVPQTADPPTAPVTASVAGAIIPGPVLHDDLLVEPPLWRNLPNAARRQLVSCLRDTWDLRSDIDKDHSQATCYSTQSQTHIQQHRLSLKEADEAARDIESCRRTLQDCYFKATQAILQIRDSADPALAEIRKKDVYGLLEIAEQARKDADSHFEFLAQLGSRREALLHEAEATELEAGTLSARATRPLPDVPVIFMDGPTRTQCGEVEEECAAIRALAATAHPLAAATTADSIFAIENILAEARATLGQATTRWERLRSSVDHLTGKLSRLGESWRTLDQDRANLQSKIKSVQHAVRFSAESAARFDRDVAAVIARLGPTRPELHTLPEAVLVRQFAREAAAAVRRLDSIASEAATLTTPEQVESLLQGAQAAKEAAAEALNQASAAQRSFNRYAREGESGPTPSPTPSPSISGGLAPGSASTENEAASSVTPAAAAEVEAAPAPPAEPQRTPIRPAGPRSSFRRRAAVALFLALLAGISFLAWQAGQPPAASAGTVPAKLRFGLITEQGNPRFHPEATLTLVRDGQPSAPVPVSSNITVSTGLEKIPPGPQTRLSLILSAPGFADSRPWPVPASPQDTLQLPPFELVRQSTAPAPEQLPPSLSVRSLQPATVTVSDGKHGLTLTSGSPLDLTTFRAPGPGQPLILTFSAEGYQPATRTILPVSVDGAGEPLTVHLDPILTEFRWRSDPPNWFSGARLTRMDPPADPRLGTTFEWPSPGPSVPVGRYAYSGVWGNVAMPLGEVILTPASSETVLKSPLPTRLRWTGRLDLNPQTVLAGPTEVFKSTAAGWTLHLPAPFFLELHAGGNATLHLFTPQIMQLSLMGLIAGSVAGPVNGNAAPNARIAGDALIRSLLAETAAGKSLGEWFSGFWQVQADSKLARSEEWRTSTMVQSEHEVAFLRGILTSPDPWSYLGNPSYSGLAQKFLESVPLQVEALSPEGLKLVNPGKTAELLVAPDGQSARFTHPSRGLIDLPAR